MIKDLMKTEDGQEVKLNEAEKAAYEDLVNVMNGLSVDALNELNKNYDRFMVDDLVEKIKDGSVEAADAIEEILDFNLPIRLPLVMERISAAILSSWREASKSAEI